MGRSWYMTEPLPLANPFAADPLLGAWLERALPGEYRDEICGDLERFGQRVADEIEPLGRAAEANEPRLDEQNNAVLTDPAWDRLDAISAEEKLVAAGYERKYGRYSRLYQFAKIYLFHPSSAYYSCPLAMTDGAAKLIETYGSDELQGSAFRHLTSADPDEFWTSGQWMTERNGGSDLSGTECIAAQAADGWTVSGPKHFTSAITAPMAMLLARTDPASPELSLFYTQCRESKAGPWRNLRIEKLKDKLGTRALPTAELTLEALPCTLVGNEGRGVRTIASLFNVTRIHNAFAATSTTARALQLWDRFARKRVSFGKPVIEHSLHRKVYGEMLAEHRRQFLLTFFVAELFGAAECDDDPAADKLLRLMTPVVKLYTAKQAIRIVSEALEGLGGAGYMEDLGMAKHYRDVQTLSIWEGTTNVLSLDVLRAVQKENVLPAWFAWAGAAECERLSRFDLAEETARDFAFLLAATTADILVSRDAGPEAGGS
ncbi:MAG: acyl-CoA dehydrogenase family protein [Woeseiaceae bacterium]|jgi:putative acyl-CoA dehydrogenase